MFVEDFPKVDSEISQFLDYISQFNLLEYFEEKLDMLVVPNLPSLLLQSLIEKLLVIKQETLLGLLITVMIRMKNCSLALTILSRCASLGRRSPLSGGRLVSCLYTYFTDTITFCSIHIIYLQQIFEIKELSSSLSALSSVDMCHNMESFRPELEPRQRCKITLKMLIVLRTLFVHNKVKR